MTYLGISYNRSNELITYLGIVIYAAGLSLWDVES